MSLANYIRHIISLSSGNSTTNTQMTLVLQQQQQQQQQQFLRQQKLQACRPTSSIPTQQARNSSGTRVQDAALLSLPSPLSAGPGPVKSSAAMSMRKHRYLSEYHDYQARRQMHHHHQQQSSDQGRRDVEQAKHQQSRQTLESQESPEEHVHRLPSPTSPTFLAGRRLSQRQAQSVAMSFPALLKVPFPNLTLTLALIYVDRLKAKYPDAKGEPGCSLRLFLVAYIIAAKYRCSVELAALMRKYNTCILKCEAEDLEESYDSSNSTSIIERLASANLMTPTTPITPNIPKKSAQTTREHSRDEAAKLEQRLWDMRSYAELIFSNQEWVRLLSLGSFFRPPSVAQSSSSAGTTAAAMNTRTSPNQPMDRSTHSSTSPGKFEPKSLPIQSIPPTELAGVESANTLSCDTKSKSMTNLNSAQITAPTTATTNVTTTTATTTATTTPPPTTTATTSTTPTSILQVEDLDRMETEFLTFLSFDLSTKNQDLDTCWNLLIGNKEL
ncbi:hypothetical protein BGX26_002770 [Mortierella sp. AD094]|nr:hypothetical protein BGX26_002770 [Mortierella sp. AD094]